MISVRFLIVAALLVWAVLFVMSDFDWQHATLMLLFLISVAGLIVGFIMAPFGFFDSNS
jgi:hypothetical protein